MLETTTGAMQMREHPLRGGLRLGDCARVAGARGQGRQRLDGPAVFARVEVRVDAGNAFGAALRVGEREVLAGVLAVDEVRVLARVKRPLRRPQERDEIAMNGLGHGEIARLVP